MGPSARAPCGRCCKQGHVTGGGGPEGLRVRGAGGASRGALGAPAGGAGAPHGVPGFRRPGSAVRRAPPQGGDGGGSAARPASASRPPGLGKHGESRCASAARSGVARDVQRGFLIKAAAPGKVPGVDPVLPVCCVLLGEAVLQIKLRPAYCSGVDLA